MQWSVTLSLTKVKYIALLEMATEIVFIKNIVEFIGERISCPIDIQVDNINAIYMANTASTSQRTKHVDMCYHFVHEYIEGRKLKNGIVWLKDNQASMFTKNTWIELFQRHLSKFMGPKK